MTNMFLPKVFLNKVTYDAARISSPTDDENTNKANTYDQEECQNETKLLNDILNLNQKNSTECFKNLFTLKLHWATHAQTVTSKWLNGCVFWPMNRYFVCPSLAKILFV